MRTLNEVQARSDALNTFVDKTLSRAERLLDERDEARFLSVVLAFTLLATLVLK